MAPGTKLLLGIFCIAFLGLLQNVEGTGTIEVHFLLYTDDCDEDWHTNKCDPKFRFCLSTPQRGRLTVGSCNYASTRQSDDDFQNTNYINMEYRTSIGGLSNPWIVHIQRFIEPSVMLVIEAIDDDFFKDDHMQTWGKTLTETIWPDMEHAVWQERVMSQNSYTMKFKVRMYCDPYYYTTACDKYCKPEDSSNGHYTCDPVTGDKICLPGWKGIQCTEDIDECALGYCVRGSCTNSPGDYICRCPPNYTDKNCSTLMNACRYAPCQNNGTCFRHATEHLYICHCTPEWEGQNCETRKSPCETSPCLNNGACVSSPDRTNYTCSCVVPYTGANCETAVTTIQPSLQTEMTSPPTPQTSPGMANETSSTTTESQDANVQQQLLQEKDEGGFQLWYIAIIIAVVLLIFIILALLFMRRRKSKAEKNSSTPGHVITFIGDDLSFDNGTYATVNRVNSEIDKQTRQLPAVPSSRIPDDALKSTYACVDESDGATGGSKTDDSGLKKRASDCDKKTDAAGLGALTRPANDRAQTNPYADFRSLRDSQVVLMNPSEGPQEEDAYHDLDDIAAQMHSDEDGQNDSADGTFSYIIPDTPIVTVQSSPYDSPPNNASYYDTPKVNLSSPFVPELNNNKLTPGGEIADNDFSPYVNALDNDSDDDDALQEDILKLRNEVEANVSTS